MKLVISMLEKKHTEKMNSIRIIDNSDFKINCTCRVLLKADVHSSFSQCTMNNSCSNKRQNATNYSWREFARNEKLCKLNVRVAGTMWTLVQTSEWPALCERWYRRQSGRQSAIAGVSVIAGVLRHRYTHLVHAKFCERTLQHFVVDYALVL